MNKPHTHPSLPWWRVPMVWLVIGGPALVVVASMATLALAIVGRDVPLREMVASQPAQTGTHTPAAQARNHAVTANH